MNKKISVGVTISLIAIACAVTFVITWTISFNMYNDMIPAVPRDELNAKLQEIDAFIRNNYYREISDSGVNNGIFAGYISGLDDKNTIYMPADEYAKTNREESGVMVTAGIRAEREESGYLRVAEVYRGSSAESAGILRGDIITEVNETSVLTLGAETALRQIETGEEYTRVQLTTQREGQQQSHNLLRQSLEISSLEYAVTADVAIVRITSFNALTDRQFGEAVRTMFADNEGIRGLIVDLRDNDSQARTGIQPTLQSLANHLVSKDAVLARTERRGVTQPFISAGVGTILPEYAANIPVIVLVNSSTSGAGEFVAAVFKGDAGARVVGTRTPGNAYLQQTQELRDGSAIRVTVARIMLESGVDYSAGVPLDFEVDMDGGANYNLQSLRGLEWQEISDPHLHKAFEIIYTG